MVLYICIIFLEIILDLIREYCTFIVIVWVEHVGRFHAGALFDSVGNTPHRLLTQGIHLFYKNSK